MPHPAATPPVPPPAPVPVTGPLAGLLSEQATLWGVFIALARIGMQFLIRFLPHTATLARNYPRHWHALVESNLSFLRVLLTVRFAPERITISQFRKLWRARQLIESLFGCPLPIFHATPLGARTPSSATATAHQHLSSSPNSPSATPLGPRTSSSANATFNQSPSAFPENVTPLGPRTSSSATTPSPALPAASSSNPPSPASPGNPQSAIFNLQSAIPNPQPRTPNTPSTPSTPAVRQVPFCSLSHSPSRSRSDADSPFASDAPSASDASTSTPSRSSSRSPKRSHAPASLQSIIAQLEAQEAQSQSHSDSPHSAFHTPHSSILPPFIPDVATLHAALKADTLPASCAGALLDNPADTLIRALQQVHALLHAFPQLPPSPSQSISSSNPQSPSVNPVNNVNNVHLTSDIGHWTLDDSSIPHSEFPTPHSTSPP